MVTARPGGFASNLANPSDFSDDLSVKTSGGRLYFPDETEEEFKEGKILKISDWNGKQYEMICLHTKEGYKDGINKTLEFNYVGLDRNNWANDKDIKIYYEQDDGRQD